MMYQTGSGKRCVAFQINMKLIETSEEKAWDRFAEGSPVSQFTQSWQWGEFKKSQGHEIRRLALADGDKTLAQALFIHHRSPLVGGYWYAPRGPVLRDDVKSDARNILESFFDKIKEKRMLASGLFWRCEPAIESKRGDIIPPGFVRSHAYQPASTLLIDLATSEDELLARMHEKTRYNIRLAERKGVTVRVGDSKQDLETFLQLNQETSKRDRFISQPAEYIQATYDFLRPKKMAFIRIAELEGVPLAASMEIAYGDTVTYLYGASSSQHREAMAPYALHWSAIRDAKRSGHAFYDFYGVNPEDEASPYFKSSWAGITRFKLGWGGHRVDYVGTWELPQRPLLYRVFRLIR